MKRREAKEVLVPVALIIRTALLFAILFEVVQLLQVSVSDVDDSAAREVTTVTPDEHEVLNTHLSLNSIDAEDFSVNPNSVSFVEIKNKSKNRVEGSFNKAWRRKVTYTTKGVIVEGGRNSIVNSRMTVPEASTMDLIEMSRTHIESKANVSVAICFKTLFGDIDLGIVLQWAAYNRLLGFDHIYMWYRPEMVNAARFTELQSLPYITLTLNTQGRRKNYYNQWWTEETCNRDDQFAGKYDYAMHADIDEYLWFPNQIGIKEYLLQHSTLNYLSFGKRMYTLDHRPDIDASLESYVLDMNQRDAFAVDKYPFYIENFCYASGDRQGDPFCPTWRGRSKVIVRPKMYIKIDTHGNIKVPDEAKGEIHFIPEQAHFMEWPEIFAKHNVTKREPVGFEIQSEDQVHIHNLGRAFKADNDGNYKVKYDANLKEWFKFVVSRFSNGNGEVAES
jgi:hypothetical protein